MTVYDYDYFMRACFCVRACDRYNDVGRTGVTSLCLTDRFPVHGGVSAKLQGETVDVRRPLPHRQHNRLLRGQRAGGECREQGRQEGLPVSTISIISTSKSNQMKVNLLRRVLDRYCQVDSSQCLAQLTPARVGIARFVHVKLGASPHVIR